MSDTIKAEYENIVAHDSWSQVFQALNRESMYGLNCTEARKSENKTLNRYRDVNPYDDTRIVLKRGPVDYINANLVEVKQVNRRYILTQGPLRQTVGHFWLMVWEQKTSGILMLNKIFEKNEMKCHMYWPESVGLQNKIVLEDVGLTVEMVHEENFNNYVSRVLRLEDTASGESRLIHQFHYTTWPDFGVPCSPNAFLQFLKHVRESGALEPNVGPAVVHCSAGIGRSGTFCLVDACLMMVEKGIKEINVKQVLLEMRRYRMGLVQTPDQLGFAYKAILEGQKRLSPDWDGNIEEPISGECCEERPPPPPMRTKSLHLPNTLLLQDVLPEPPSDSSDLDDESDITDTEDCTSSEDYETDPVEYKRKSVINEGNAKNPESNYGTEKGGQKGHTTLLVASAVLVGVIAVIYYYLN